MTKQKKLRHPEYYDLQECFDSLYAKSKQGEVFAKLMDLISGEENIRLAYRNIKRNSGSHTSGTDNLNIKDIEKLSAEKLVEIIQRKLKFYKPKSVRRVEIPKPNGKTRPLGIPTIVDRLVQQCILQVLEPICEAKFHERSNGFRPNRSAENALAQCYKMIHRQHLYFVVDVDIKGFFDNVNHSKLIRQMWAMGIQDKQLICIIKQMLKAPIILPDGNKVFPTKGTPQGGILSPLLANIVLNELDWWIDSQWQNHPLAYHGKPQYNQQGVLDKSHGYGTMRKTHLKEVYIVRYADDFRIFCSTRSEAIRIKAAVTQWLKERLRLEVSQEKTKVVNLRKGYSSFLGIKMRLRRKEDKMVVHSVITEKAKQRIKAQAKQKMLEIVHPPHGITEAQAIVRYNSFVMGEHNYYCMATAVSKDFRDIGYLLTRTEKRLGDRLKKEPSRLVKEAVYDRYCHSGRLRFIRHYPIAPISYVQTKAPICKKRAIQKYTPEGRRCIHDDLGIPTAVLHALLHQPVHVQSTALADNRLSLFCAQYGKCAVTGKVFSSPDDIHCHHLLPRHMGGKDTYDNLILITPNIHILIHATIADTIQSYLSKVSLNAKQMAKLNRLRSKVGNPPIIL